MGKLAGRRILLGVGGGIAAYKAAPLIRLLRGEGAEVRVVMTEAATRFMPPLTLQALSGNPVRLALFDTEQEQAMGHIELARWAELVLIAPATADLLARLAHGLADDLLTTLCLAATAPLALAPAMNHVMWRNPATQANAALLAARGAMLWGPADGEQACGETGPGRLLEPEALLDQVDRYFGADSDSGALRGVRVLLTAGPTREPIDPVRYVGNRSSGKMGYALARAFRDAGATVELISGPVALKAPEGVSTTLVETALEMHAAVMARVGQCAIFVGCAAVADYRPERPAPSKIKKHQADLHVTLVRNPDILADVAAMAAPPFTLGFAAETERVEAQAEAKRRAKGVDMIAANLVGSGPGGFESEQNALTVLWNEGREALPLTDKERLADRLATLVTRIYHERNRA